MFGLIKESRLKELQKEFYELKLRLDRCREIEAQNRLLRDKIQESENKISELKNQIRKQTKADLFFKSAKIQKKLLDGEPKENVKLLDLKKLAYQQQLAQMQLAYPYNFFTGLGLSNPFGNLPQK